MTTWFLIWGEICLGGVANSQVQKYRRKSRLEREKGNELSVGHVLRVPVDKAWREPVTILWGLSFFWFCFVWNWVEFLLSVLSSLCVCVHTPKSYSMLGYLFIYNLMFDSGWSERSGCRVMEKQRLEKQTGRLGVWSASVQPRAV